MDSLNCPWLPQIVWSNSIPRVRFEIQILISIRDNLLIIGSKNNSQCFLGKLPPKLMHSKQKTLRIPWKECTTLRLEPKGGHSVFAYPSHGKPDVYSLQEKGTKFQRVISYKQILQNLREFDDTEDFSKSTNFEKGDKLGYLWNNGKRIEIIVRRINGHRSKIFVDIPCEYWIPNMAHSSLVPYCLRPPYSFM